MLDSLNDILYFNSTKVQLEHIRISVILSFINYFNSTKVQLERWAITKWEDQRVISIPLRYN